MTIQKLASQYVHTVYFKFQQFMYEYPISLAMVGYLLFFYITLQYDIFQVSHLSKMLIAVSIAPICMFYLLFRWGAPLLWLWNTPGGKLIYVLASAIIYTVCKTSADKAISSTLQSNASHFPNAQNNLTLYFIIFGVLGLIGVTMKLTYFFVIAFTSVIGISLLAIRMMTTEISKTILQFHPDMNDLNDWTLVRLARNVSQRVSFKTIFVAFIDTFVVLLCGIFITEIPISIDRPSWLKDKSGHFVSLTEQTLFWSSFYPNIISDSAEGEFQKLVCSNLPPDVDISAANPDDVIPHDVVVAEIKKGKRQASENTYIYRLSKCENTNDPDHIRK